MQYCPHNELGGRANVIVAGNAVPGTMSLISPFVSHCLSKNEGTVTAQLIAENASQLTAQNSIAQTSTGIACELVKQGLPHSWHFASSDQFSVDTLFGLFVLIDECKSVSPDILIPIAKMALYEHGEDRDLAHIVFILNSWMHSEDSPLNSQIFQLPTKEVANVLFEELLSRAPKIISKVDYLERYWLKEELKLELTEKLLEEGTISIETFEALDLAVFSIEPAEFKNNGRLFNASAGRFTYQTAGQSQDWVNCLHPMGLHNRTSCSRILLQSGLRRYFYYRAESFALHTKELVAPRRDLAVLANELNEHEEGGLFWLADEIDALKPSLSQPTSGISQIDQQTFLSILCAFLQN